MSYVLGIDLGTGSMKGVLLDKYGVLINQHSENYSSSSPQDGFSEQDPQDWLNAFDAILKKLIEEAPEIVDKLEGISFSGQMHSLVVTDQNHKVIRPAILWNDVRTTKECTLIKDKLGNRLIEITRNKATEGFTLPKILWLMNNELENWEKVKHVMMPKDYLGFYLTGNYFTDYSDAAGTLLLDVATKEWSKEILDTFQISEDILPKLFLSSEQVGVLKEDLKEKFGINTNVKVFAGGADNPCSALGSGLVFDNNAMVSTGTSGVVLSAERSSNVNYNGELHVFNHVVDEQLYSMGVTLSAGNSLNWFKKQFYPNESFNEMIEEAKSIDVGAEGMLFTPYIMGERTPYTDSTIRGSFIGIDIKHTKAHFLRAILEGIIFSLKDSLVIIENSKKIKRIIATGGGAKSTVWLQIQADIFNTEIITIKSGEGPSIGAAILAAVGLNWFDSISDCVESFVSYSKPIVPIKENVEKYIKYYKIYQTVYDNTKDISLQLKKI